MKLTIEQCSKLFISSLQKTIRKMIDRDYPDATEEEIFEYTKRELQAFTVNNQHFQYSFMRNVLGGYRWFFICDKCRKRAAKLFLPPESDRNRKHYYWCKRCHNIINESAARANNSIFRKVIKPLRRLNEIEKILEKGYVRPDKIESLLNEYDKIEKVMKSCPEYRLYAFKKKRGMKILS